MIEGIGIHHQSRFHRHRGWLAISNDLGSPTEALASFVIKPHRADGDFLLPLNNGIYLPYGYDVGAERSLVNLKALGCGTQEATILLTRT